MDKIEIEVNGTLIKLTEFPAKIIMNTILGMLKSLHEVGTIENAVIKLEKDPD
ncbi:MAG: hypothetical protein Q7J07_04840 [Pelolinea sp.]|nr:hypothetical protein [Pelolinea sp.]